MKAIETKWKGWRFRSRTEARWAVYFSAIGLKWEYEPEGFDLGGVFYLPDFWLPEVHVWAEVKATEFTEVENRKLRMLAEQSGFSAVQLIGTPDCRSYPIWNAWRHSDGRVELVETDCVISGYKGYKRFYVATGFSTPFGEPDDWTYLFVDVPKAVQAARSARFEHGEVPV